MKNNITKIIAVLFLLQFAQIIFANDDSFESFRKIHRINAHGDEFMAIDLSSDNKRIAVGTEKGEVIIWNILDKKIEKRLKQNFPVHAVVFINDGQSIVAAGGEHIGKHNCSLGSWNIATEKFQNWNECGNDSLMYLSVDKRSGIVATSDANGFVTMWNGSDGKQVAVWNTKKTTLGLAVSEKTVYLSQTSKQLINQPDDDEESIPVEIYKLSAESSKKKEQVFVPKKNGRILVTMEFSPDNKMLAVRGVEDQEYKYFIFDPKNGNLITSIKAYQAKWMSNEKILVSDNDSPNEIVKIGKDGTTTIETINKGGGFRSAGSPANLTGIAVSNDGNKVWSTFQIGGFLVEYDLAKKTADALISSNSLPFAMDVFEIGNNKGYLVTGGDDKFVRLWNLEDMVLLWEFKTEVGVPQGVALLNDGKSLIFSSSSKEAPTKIFKAEIQTGNIKEILSISEPFVSVRKAEVGFVYNFGKKIILASADVGSKIREFEFTEEISKFDTSANGKWLAVADEKGNLWKIDLQNGKREQWSGGQIEDLTRITITNDGKYVYTTEFQANLRRWDTVKQKSDSLGSYRGQAFFLKLSVDEKYVLIGGNHHDIGVYNAKTGEHVFYTQDESSDFYVTNGWMKGNRLIYTTDGGVLVDGLLNK